MSDADATAKIAEIYAALMAAHNVHPNSRVLDILHARLGEGLEMLIADRPGVVRPYDGGQPKPPSP